MQEVSRKMKQRVYYLEHKEELLLKKAIYCSVNKEKIRASKKRYRLKNRERLRDSARIYRMNPAVHLAKNLRHRLYMMTRRCSKSGSAVRDLGCSIYEFRAYIESLFSLGMNWDNYGKWHLDHIRPLVSFDLADREQLLQACHFTNIQPLWAEDNFRKGGKRGFSD